MSITYCNQNILRFLKKLNVSKIQQLIKISANDMIYDNNLLIVYIWKYITTVAMTTKNTCLSLPPVFCRSTHVLFTLFVFVYVQWCPTHIVLCYLFCLPSSCVLYTQCCCFFCFLQSWLPLRYSLTIFADDKIILYVHLHPYLKIYNHVGGVMVSVFVGGRSWVRAPMGSNEDHNICIYCVSAKHTALRNKSND